MAKKIILAIFFIEKSQAKSIIKDMLATKFYIKIFRTYSIGTPFSVAELDSVIFTSTYWPI